MTKEETSSLLTIFYCHFLLLQSISPGLVRTEFSGRLHKDEDLEESKKTSYEDSCVSRWLANNSIVVTI